MSRLFLVRHGQASFLERNYDKLSAKGEEQARILGKYWAGLNLGFDRVYSGPRVRQRETARIAGEAYKAAGHPGEGKVFLRAPVYVAETEEQARNEPEESIMFFYRYLGERLEDSATRAGVRAIEDRAARGRRLQTLTYDEALRDKIIVGTPERVADRLMGLKEELGLDGILAEMNCGTKIANRQVMKSLQLLCEKVKPQFH